ncbi:MAG: iron ABC transporter permease [Chitinophagaceae bacterium]|nr:iron ABC transporter permease [Chitinophagaceae bacterium]
MSIQRTDNQKAERKLAEQRYDHLQKKRLLIIAAITISCFISFCFDIVTGPSSLSVKDVFTALFHSSSTDTAIDVIVWKVRMPYALMALLTGMALSVAGAEMQTILNNPLASPFTLGVSASATFGAALAIVLGITLPGISANWVVSLNAFLFAFGSVLLLQAFARWKNSGVGSLVLFGIALVFTFNALVALIHYIATPEALQQVVFWSMGSLARANWEKIQMLALVIVLVVPFTMASSWKMTALRLGEERAAGLGIRVNRFRFMSLLRISLLAATSVAFVGTIGFIGLVGPHIARMLVGEDHRYWFPASLVTGALVMSLASIASKLLVPGTLLPVGIVTALIGVPVFVYLIMRKDRQS